MTKQEILRNELEVFFDDWGFSVSLLEESTDDYPLFQIGPLGTASFLNDDGKFFFIGLVPKVAVLSNVKISSSIPRFLSYRLGWNSR